MNVYDFDNTIYKGDSTVDFFKWCLKKKPALSVSLLKGGAYFCAYALKKCSKTNFKEKLYSIIQHIPNIDCFVEEFWDAHIKNIKAWYLTYQKQDDVIISASPEFLLKPVCQRLGIKHLLASQVDKDTGFYYGINCYGAEKVRRYREVFNEQIDIFYSDSLSDKPLANIASKAYLVDGDRLIPWK